MNLKGLNLSVFLGLGSNVGDREQNLAKVLYAISEISDCAIEHLSSVYISEPWGNKEQDPFLNQVIEIETKLNPLRLLAACQEIEGTMGRRKSARWGPRIIDIDILLYHHQVVDEKSLKIPHPRLTERKFVLIPLVEIAPSLVIPGSGKTTREFLKECRDTAGVLHYRKSQEKTRRIPW